VRGVLPVNDRIPGKKFVIPERQAMAYPEFHFSEARVHGFRLRSLKLRGGMTAAIIGRSEAGGGARGG